MAPDLNLKSLRIPVSLDARCVVRTPASGAAPAQAILLLHGYSETGSRMARALAAYLPDDALVIAPDGIFPMAMRTAKGHRLAHCWYLYDPETDEYAVDMRAGIEYMQGVIAALVPAGMPITLVGFSQGGYFAPFLGQKVPGVRRVVGIASQYLVEELDGPITFEAHGVHGEIDQIVDPSIASNAHKKLLVGGAKGTFTLIPGSAHAIDAAIGKRVGELLKSP